MCRTVGGGRLGAAAGGRQGAPVHVLEHSGGVGSGALVLQRPQPYHGVLFPLQKHVVEACHVCGARMPFCCMQMTMMVLVYSWWFRQNVYVSQLL